MCNIFNEKIHFAIENFIPKISPKNQIAGYSNNEIKQLIRQKNRKWQKYKRDRTSRNKNDYNRFTKYVSRRVREIKGKYERNIFQGKTKSLKFFYNYVKNITGNKSDSDIPDLVVNQFSFTSDYQKALVLADQYRSVYQTDNGTIPFSHQQMPEDSFCDITVTDEDVVMAIRQMNSNSAPGDDGIPAQFIKNLSCYLIKPLHTIFQESFRSGVVPSAWRIGITIPIYKRNRKPEDPASYRPVCLTSVVGKLAERVFLSVLTHYIQENFIISDSQHTFISGKSTATNLIECINEWTKKIDAMEPVDILYIDLAKAIDSVCHAKLLRKLKQIGIGGTILAWLEAFLTTRTHYVRVKNDTSPCEPVLSGIPQGTILGPTLFITFINEVMDKNISASLKLFADDAKLFRTVSDTDQAALMQQDINQIISYFSDWQLKVNPSKCELLHLGVRNQRHNYSIDGEQVPKVNNCRDLGVKVSDDNKFSLHVTEIVRSAYHRLKQIRICFSCHDVDFRLHMYNIYVRPVLEYNTVIWSPHLLKNIDKIEGVQRLFTRTLAGMSNLTYDQRLQRLKLKSLEERRIVGI